MLKAAKRWMNVFGCSCIFFPLLAFSGDLSSNDEQSIAYARSDRMYELEFVFADTYKGSKILPRRVGEVLDDDMITVLVDCSDENYRCLSWGSSVIAVPKSEFRFQMTYERNGVSFKVEKCASFNWVSSAGACDVALISATCRYLAFMDFKCLSTRKSPSTAPIESGYIRYFIFNRNFGITAMGHADVRHRSLDKMMSIASYLTLTGSRGLLGN